MDYLNLMNSVSDTLGVQLQVDQGGEVSGGSQGRYKLLPGLVAEMPLTPQVLFISKDSGGVLFHVIGNLYMLVGVKLSNRVVSIHMLDHAKASHADFKTLLGKSFDLSMAYKALAHAVVASYVWRQAPKGSDPSGWARIEVKKPTKA
jgi:hypothetical protein